MYEFHLHFDVNWAFVYLQISSCLWKALKKISFRDFKFFWNRIKTLKSEIRTWIFRFSLTQITSFVPCKNFFPATWYQLQQTFTDRLDEGETIFFLWIFCYHFIFLEQLPEVVVFSVLNFNYSRYEKKTNFYGKEIFEQQLFQLQNHR